MLHDVFQIVHEYFSNDSIVQRWAGLFINGNDECRYRCTPFNPPPVNPPNLVIHQNYKERWTLRSFEFGTNFTKEGPVGILLPLQAAKK